MFASNRPSKFKFRGSSQNLVAGVAHVAMSKIIALEEREEREEERRRTTFHKYCTIDCKQKSNASPTSVCAAGHRLRRASTTAAVHVVTTKRAPDITVTCGNVHIE